jgi:hypothetical protein
MPALVFDNDIFPVEHTKEPPDYTYYNPIIYQMWCYLADKIENDPSLLSIPLENMDRWIKQGIWGQDMLARWRVIIEAAQQNQQGLQRLAAFLRSDSEEARHMKSFNPFPGVLSSTESDRFVCTWTH